MPDGEQPVRKVFVLDTSVLIHAPECANRHFTPFGSHDVVIPTMALKELDGLKGDPRRGRTVREVIRFLDETFLNVESAANGVTTHGGGHLSMVGVKDGDGSFVLPSEFNGNTGDEFVLRVAGNLHHGELKKEPHERRQVVLLSKDLSLRVIARAAGVESDDLKAGKVVKPESLAPRVHDIDASTDIIDELFQRGSIPADDLQMPFGIRPNECCRLIDSEGTKHALGIFVSGDRIVVTRNGHKGRKGIIAPRNAEQTFAYNFVMREEILTTILIGTAGTGKTLMALKAGVDLLDSGAIKRIICFRPMIELGSPIGYLPGSLGEKFGPWAMPIFANLHLLLGNGATTNGASDENKSDGGDAKKAKTYSSRPQGEHKDKLSSLLEQELIQIKPVTFIRGATLPNSLIIVDEAQNLTPHEITALLTRAGEGSRVVLTGDLTQIDTPHLDAASCGIAKALERTKGHPEFAAIELVKGERSRLATLAAELFAGL